MIRVVAVSPEPTPYRSPLFDRIAARGDIDLTVAYAAATVADRSWTVEPHHRSLLLRGVELPLARRILRHEYPVTPGIVPLLERTKPDCVVASGWSTFASQAAILWCRLRRVPYLLVVESHDRGPRSGWRRVVKGAVVPRVVRGAVGALVTGSLARESMLARGARPERVRVFANTIDVAQLAERARRLAPSRAELRAALGLQPGEICVLSVARLVPEKGLDTLLEACAMAGAPLVPVVVGEGPQRMRLGRRAAELGVPLRLPGGLPWERVVEAYVAADVFALCSLHEPWGVAVNEAAACGLPLVLSDRVGAAYDLLFPGESGEMVPAGDAAATAGALRRLADDDGWRKRAGARAREIVSTWGYEPSVEAFAELVHEAVRERRPGSR